MEVGVDTYLDIIEANALVSQNFLSDEATSTIWNSLSDDDKAILLVRGTRDIDSVMYRGVTKQPISIQKLKFPRVIDCITVTPNDNIKLATIIQSVSYKSGVSKQSSLRKNLQSQGVTSVKIGKIAETYDTGISFSSTSNLASEAVKYIEKYIARGGVIV